MDLKKLSDDELLERLTTIARRHQWTVEDIQDLDDQAALLSEIKRRGLKMGEGNNGEVDG